MPPSGVTVCNDCRFWQRGLAEGLCRRHAPATAERPYTIARWPETRVLDGCGEGQAAADGDAADGDKGQACGSCAFWHRPGAGIEPAQRSDRLAAWWRQAGFCRRHAPRPGTEIGEHAFWCATHADDHCFDGRPA